MTEMLNIEDKGKKNFFPSDGMIFFFFFLRMKFKDPYVFDSAFHHKNKRQEQQFWMTYSIKSFKILILQNFIYF